MYTQHFGLRELPFNITPDPRFLYLNDCYQEAIAALGYGIESRKGFLSLIGEAGTGKTTLLRRVLDTLDARVRTVLLLHPTVAFDEILEHILQELGIPLEGAGKLGRLQRLNEFLLEHTRTGGNVALLIDEAQDLAPVVLEELRLLSNLETGREKILQIVLAGQPELEARLADPALRQLRQRIALHVRIRPLSPAEVAGYVQARLERAGAAGPGLFTPEALARVAAASTGIPRIVNVLCDATLLTAFALGARQVTPEIVDEAWADQAGGLPAVVAPEPNVPPPAIRVTPPLPHPLPPASPVVRTRWSLRRAVAAAAAVALVAAIGWVVVGLRGAREVPVAIWRDDVASAPPLAVTPPPAPVEAPPAAAAVVPAVESVPAEIAAPREPPPEPAAEELPAPVVAAVAPPPPPPPLPAGPPTAAEAVTVVEAFRVAYAARDAEAVAAVFSSDGRVNRARGRDAVAALYRATFRPWSAAQLTLPELQVIQQAPRTVVRSPLRIRYQRADGQPGQSTAWGEFQVERRDGVVRIVSLTYRYGSPAPARRRPAPPARPAAVPPPRRPAAGAARGD
ncbi:MAG: AAA family ATPase [Candidatus Binatia bacterium]